MGIISKISVKTVCGDAKKIAKEMGDLEKKPIMQIIGICTGTQSGTSNFGDWTALKGQFKAINLITGEMVVSGKAFLPEIAIDAVSGQLSNEVDSVEFAFNIVLKLDDSSNTGYVYQIDPLIEAQENNPLALLEERIKK